MNYSLLLFIIIFCLDLFFGFLIIITYFLYTKAWINAIVYYYSIDELWLFGCPRIQV